MGIFKKLKLYRIKTLSDLGLRMWNKSKVIALRSNKSRFIIFLDMINCSRKYGASEENYEQFDFVHHNHEYRDKFITWRRNIEFMKAFNTPEACALFLDKTKWNERFASYVKRDLIYSERCTEKELRSFVRKHKEVIVKPFNAACGVGITIVNEFNINDVLPVLQKERFIIERKINNTEIIKQFSPSSLNTIRVVTIIDRQGSVNIVAVLLRVGNGISHTDNFCTGGIAAPIDIETGIVCGNGSNVKGETFIEHPVTGIKFKGFEIPLFREIKDLCIELALECPDARMVGWDIVLNDCGGIDVLEGNVPPAEELVEIELKGRYYELKKYI